MERQENEDVNPPREASDGPSIAQVFLKIISAQIEVKEDETKFSKQIQEAELVVQVKHSLSFKTKPSPGSLTPQWHAGFTFSVQDPKSYIKVKLISTKRLINSTLGKISLPLDTLEEYPIVLEMPLKSIDKKLASVKLTIIMMRVKFDAKAMARKYMVIKSFVRVNKFTHLNSSYYSTKDVVAMHPAFKIVLERANYIAGEVVRGAVIFDLAKDEHNIYHIRIIAMGTESSSWTEGSGKSSVSYHDSRRILGIQKYVNCSPNREGASLSAGVQVYPFELQLPAGLLSSVSYCGASVTYVISAECVSSKNWSATKFADAYFNVYGAETKFKLPLRLRGPIFRIRKHLKDDWSGEVTLSSRKQYPNSEYVISIKYHNVDKVAVRDIKVSMKTILILRVQSKFDRQRDYEWTLLRDFIPMHDTTEEHVHYEYRYTMPPCPPTVAPVDGVQLFEFHTIVKISVALANSNVSRRVLPIIVGTVVTEDFAREPHVVNADTTPGLKVYKAKSTMVHGLVAYKSRSSVQFFDEKIFSSYNAADLVQITNVYDIGKNNNTNVRNQDS